MRSMFKHKLVSLVAVLALLLVTITGCDTADKLVVAPTEVEGNASGDQTSKETASESETTSSTNEDGSSDATTGDKTDDTTDNQTSSSKDQTETKKPGSTTTEQTTSKKPDNTTTGQTTTKKPSPSTEQTTTASSSSSITNAEKMAKEIVDTIITSGMSDFEKAITIHDWLTFNLDYDFTYSNYYVEETLRDRKCVCQGYALTFEMMCEMAGLEVTFVGGTANNNNSLTDWEAHAWNQVKIDGKWYNVDVTWDDPATPGKDPIDHKGNKYDYFLIADTRIYKDHKTTSLDTQTCSSDYDYKTILQYAANSGIHKGVAFASNKTEFTDAMKCAMESNNTNVIIWYYDATVTKENMWNVLEDLIAEGPYPACRIDVQPSYPPSNGVTKYILSLTPLSEWNTISVVTTASALTTLIDETFDTGATTLTVRYEPTNGTPTVYAGKYGFSYCYDEYNDGKCMLMTITKS